VICFDSEGEETLSSNVIQMVQRQAKEQESPTLRVTLEARAKLPTRFGQFEMVAFANNRDRHEHAAVVRGSLEGAEGVLVRLHSECLTGDAFGSLKCDCRDQLEQALKLVGKEDTGAVLYLRQEGRSIGLVNKIRAYALQDEGLDTVDANLALGLPDDARDYEIAARMLQQLGIRSVRLMTNNPDKVRQLEKHGIRVLERVAHQLPANGHNVKYLQTKAARSGHLLDGEALLGDLDGA